MGGRGWGGRTCSAHGETQDADRMLGGYKLAAAADVCVTHTHTHGRELQTAVLRAETIRHTSHLTATSLAAWSPRHKC